MTDHVFMFQGGRIYQSIQSLTLVNNTAKTIDTEIGAYRLWLTHLKATNPDNVTRDINVEIYKEAAKTNHLRKLTYQAAVAAGGRIEWPNSITGAADKTGLYAPIFLEEFNVLTVVWAAGGASAGATDADGLVIEGMAMEV